MPIYDATKRIKAEDVAAALFEWDFFALKDETGTVHKRSEAALQIVLTSIANLSAILAE